MVIQLRLAEKQILEKVLSSGRTKRLQFQKKLEDDAPLPCYKESNIALLENKDAKLPIILHKLEQMEEGQEIHVEEQSHLLNWEKVVCGMDMEANGQVVQDSSRANSQEMTGKKEIREDLNSHLDSVGSSAKKGQKEMASVSASRTDHNPKEESE